jgi:hypothetical protein
VVLPDERRREAAPELRALGTPDLLAGVFVEREEKGTLVLIANENEQVTRKNRGSASAELHHRGGDGVTPLLLARGIVRQQAKRAEVNEHAFPVRCGRRGGGIADAVRWFDLFRWRGLSP